MKVLIRLFIGVVILVALITVGGFFLPSARHIERSHTYAAPQRDVYALISTMSAWAKWSPWDRMDTTMKKTLVGPPSGVGAGYTWTSEDMGDGRLTVVAADATHLACDLEFGGQPPARANFLFAPDGKGTKVTWTLDVDAGLNPYKRIFGLFLDKMVGTDFENGLNNIDSVLRTMPPSVTVREDTFQGGPALTMRVQCRPEEIGSKLAAIYGAAMKASAEKHLTMVGHPFSIYHTFEPQKGIVDMEAGFCVNTAPSVKPPLAAVTLPPGKVIVADYHGPYEGSAIAWTAIEDYAKAHNLTLDGSPWESYVTDPMTEPDTSKWLTQIYYRVK